MKILRYITFCALVLQALTSCNDGNDMYGEFVRPVFTLSGDLEWHSNVIAEDWPTEMGCFLEPVKAGRVTGLCVQLPVDGLYRVTLWRTADTVVLASMNINTLAGADQCEDIFPVEVEAGHRYAVTVLTNHWYRFLGPPDRPIYRAQIGDMEIVSYAERYDPDGFELPGSHAHNWLKGLADVIYEPRID